MKIITHKDLQLEIEQELNNQINSVLTNIFGELNLKKQKSYNEEKYFYELLKHSVEIKNHYAVNSIIKRIKNNLNLEKIDLRIFLYQNNIFNVSCFPRKLKNNITELQIFVSQHFFNNLNEDEQVGIIGHEIAHHLFDHFKYNAKDLINYPFDFGDTGDFKSNLIYHTKVSEISADIAGLVSNDFNYKAYSTALIKYTTGLNDSANSVFSITPLIDIVLNQYDDYVKNIFFNDLHSTQPLMPVRVKIINTMAKCRLLRNFGQKVSDKQYIEYKKEYNTLINNIIKAVYPEIFPENSEINEVLIPMSVAVMLADNKIDEKELLLIKKMIEKSHREFKELTALFENSIENMSFNEIKETLIKKAVKLAKKSSFSKNLIIPVIRKLIIVAASDDKIETSELLAIYQFAKEFDISKQDIVLLIKTQYKI